MSTLFPDLYTSPPHPILQYCNTNDRTAVLLSCDQASRAFARPDDWNRSAVRTVYLFGKDDDELQRAVGDIVRSCKGKLAFRLFTVKHELTSGNALERAVRPDDRSPPFKRLIVLAFKLGGMGKAEREEFLDSLRHHVADAVVFEALGEEGGTERWAKKFREHSGLVNEKDVRIIEDEQGKPVAFQMYVRFFHQGETEMDASRRLFFRRGVSERVGPMAKLL